MKNFVAVVVFMVLIGYMALSSILSIWPFSVIRGVTKAVVNEQSIIQNYQWFYDQYNSIQAQKINYESVPKDAYERSGMLMVLNNSISEYNSRSKQITRNMWKSNDLPYQIEFVGGTK
jgi:hypothetical protein